MQNKSGEIGKVSDQLYSADAVVPAIQPCFIQQFEAQVRNTPHQNAVMVQGKQLSYNELNEQANQFAHYLQAFSSKSILIGICVPRSIEMLVGLLAIQKVGAGYVPLDPIHPAERLNLIAHDAKLDLIITHSTCKHIVEEFDCDLIVMDELSTQMQIQAKSNLGKPIDASSCVYVNFTSGTTGTPKGILIEHSSLVKFLCAMQEILQLDAQDNWLAITTLAFDIAGLELFLPLITGACVYIASEGQVNDGTRLQAIIENNHINIMQTTPTNWELLYSSGLHTTSGLTSLCGGEKLSPRLAKKLIESNRKVYNLYGPTETTIWSSCKELQGEKEEITIGKPLAHEEFYVLDKELKLIEDGKAGELYIGGVGLARGYLNLASLTDSTFIDSPFRQGERLYKTGDTVKKLANGDYDYLGRIDNQVKIRGFRVECSEVEAVLLQQTNISQAVVVAGNEQQKQLYAYVINPFEEIDPIELRNALRKQLPEQMIPSYFIQLDKLPLTPNGKIDRKSLNPPEEIHIARGHYVSPETKRENHIADIWKGLLRVDSVDRQDSFLDLGGTSLLTVQMIEEI